MKRITSLAVILCLLGAALSCTHEEPSKSERNDGNNVHEWEDSTLSGDAVMSFSINNMTVTRAGTRSTVNYAGDGNYSFVTGDKIAIQVSRTVSEAEDIEGVKLFEIQSDGTLSCLDTYPFTWRSQGDRVNIRAWHYVGAETTTTSPDGAVFSLETTQDNGYKELLYCNAPNQDYTTSNITLNFAHQLSRIVFNVKHERSGTLVITNPIVGNSTAFPVKARFTAPTGTNTVGEWTPTAYNTLTPKTETTQSGFQKTYSAVIFPKTYAQNTPLLTITSSDGNYIYKVNETAGLTLTSGNQYNYTINVKDGLYRKNPLWYVAESNVKSYDPSTKIVTLEPDATVLGAGYCTTWNTNMSWFAKQANSYNEYWDGSTITDADGIYKYHLPVVKEWYCVVPSDINIFNATYVPAGLRSTSISCIFGYNSSTKAGVDDWSYWGSIKSDVRYAIRFLGTKYCSVWKYDWTQKSSRILIVTAKLIDQLEKNSSTLSAKLSEYENKGDTWWNTNIESEGNIKRYFPGAQWSAAWAATECTTNSTSARNLFWSSSYGVYVENAEDRKKGNTSIKIVTRLFRND